MTTEDDGGGSLGAGRRWPTPIGTQRVLQIVLGLFWIVDAALQYQPFMFGNQFVPTYITANAAGQPEPVAWLITTAGHFISPNVGGVERAVRHRSALHRGRPALPAHGAPCAGDVVLLGLRGVVLR